MNWNEDRLKEERKMSRRILSLLLVLAMVLPMVPVVGSADNGGADSLSAEKI